MVQPGSVSGFGAFGLTVVAGRVEAGELMVEVESPDGRVERCGACGARARSKGRRRVVLRDAAAAGGMPVRVLWNKRVWACFDEECDARTWTEESGLAGPRRVLTSRAVDAAVGALAAVEASVASLARKLGVGWHTVWSAVQPVLEQVAGDPGRVGASARLGFDETVMGSATRFRRRRFITAAVDADTGQVIDVFDGRDAADLERWAQLRPREQMACVEVVCCDPHEGYRKAVRGLKAKGVLAKDAKVASDPFHIVRLANRALDECRRRTQNDALGHRGRKGDPLYGARKLLLMGSERLDPRGWDRLRAALDAGDPYDEVADCWNAKEKIRSVFKTRDPDQAANRLGEAIEYCRAPEAAPELHKLARTLTKWRTEIETSVRTGTHNGRTEAANAKIKDVKRSARGFTNPANYRLRILLATGRKPGHTQPVTKIRTRRPSFDA